MYILLCMVPMYMRTVSMHIIYGMVSIYMCTVDRMGSMLSQPLMCKSQVRFLMNLWISQVDYLLLNPHLQTFNSRTYIGQLPAAIPKCVIDLRPMWLSVQWKTIKRMATATVVCRLW